MTLPSFITAEDVAGLLEMPGPASFLTARHRLERDEDFPPPVPWSHRPLKWRREAIEAWIAGQGRPGPARHVTRTADNVVLLREAARP